MHMHYICTQGKTVKHTGWSKQYLALLKALTVFQTIFSKNKKSVNIYNSSLTETKHIWSLFSEIVFTVIFSKQHYVLTST